MMANAIQPRGFFATAEWASLAATMMGFVKAEKRGQANNAILITLSLTFLPCRQVINENPWQDVQRRPPVVAVHPLHKLSRHQGVNQKF